MYEFDVPGRIRGKDRPRFSRGHTYTPKKTVEYEKEIAIIAKQAGVPLFGEDTPLSVTIWAFMTPPTKWQKKRRDAAVEEQRPAIKRPDADNIAKVVLDALNGIAYEDDVQVATVVVMKRYADEEALCVVIETEE